MAAAVVIESRRKVGEGRQWNLHKELEGEMDKQWLF